MHAEAARYMMTDHADGQDFPDHFTYIPYSREGVKQKLDYIFQRLFKEKYLDCKQDRTLIRGARSIPMDYSF